MASRSWDYSQSELTADAVIHIGGLVLAVAGAISIIAAALLISDMRSAVAVSVYALSLVAAFAASAAYSMWPVGPRKWQLRKFDHAAIYFLIAGTYTPFTTVMGNKGLWMLAGIWTAAIAGALLKLAFPGRYRHVSVVLYLGLAWSGLLILDTLLNSLPLRIFALLLAGGIIYSAGVPFHLWQKLKFHKAIWHGFVLAAAAVHYKAMFLLVMMRAS
jgi:hemolysin III